MSALPKAQQEIRLYQGRPPGSETWTWREGSSNRNKFKVHTVFNVVKPSLTVFKPGTQNDKGTAVIICPGGGFHFLAIDHEGTNAAKVLIKAGITAFVLKYRLVHVTTDSPFDDMLTAIDKKKWDDEALPIIPLAIADGRQAIEYVRKHAEEFRLDRNRIGILGFSAGGVLAIQSAFENNPGNRPDFIVPVYADNRTSLQGVSFEQAPPMFLVCAEDDAFGFSESTEALYEKWKEAKRPVEMHLFKTGGHGFGIGDAKNATGGWLEKLCRWLQHHRLLD